MNIHTNHLAFGRRNHIIGGENPVIDIKPPMRTIGFPDLEKELGNRGSQNSGTPMIAKILNILS